MTTKKILVVESDPYNNRCFVLSQVKGLYSVETYLEEFREQDVSIHNGKTRFTHPVKKIRLTVSNKDSLNRIAINIKYDIRSDTLLLNLNGLRVIAWNWLQ